MKSLTILFIFFLFFLPKVYSIQLSEKAQISLLTCASGDEIYSYFGHSALRIKDPLLGVDYVYNYGIFSFDAPHFVWRFSKGETDYLLAGERMDSFMDSYHEELRSVYEQVLDITQSEKQSLFDALVKNAKKENRVYRYRHFSDNCSTRVRDQLEKCVNHQLEYDTSKDTKLTFRQLVDLCVPENSWNGFGIKLALGIPADKVTTYAEKMYLPEYLSNDMAQASIKRNGIAVPFVKPRTTIYEAPTVKSNFSLTSPAVVVNLFLIIVAGLTFLEFKRKKRRIIALDFWVFFSFGLAGLLLSFLCFVSVSEATGSNLNLIWALPTHFIFAFLWLFPSLRPKLTWYLKLTAGIILLFLVSMLFLPQTFHWLVVPICLIMLLRTGSWLIPKLSGNLGR